MSGKPSQSGQRVSGTVVGGCRHLLQTEEFGYRGEHEHDHTGVQADAVSKAEHPTEPTK